MSRAHDDGLLQRFAAALGPGESTAVMRAVGWAMVCAAGLIIFKLALPLCATAAAMLRGA